MRFLFVLVVVVLIAGVALYGAQMMGIQIPYVSQFFANMAPGGGHGGHQMPGMQGGNVMPPSPFNNLASQNKDRLVQATTILNQAMELITNDPYSQITQPSQTTPPTRDSGTGAITIPPRDGVTININPGSQRRDFPPNTGNIVYDQTKLEQLHNGIFKFSQAMMLLNELNNDLTDQSVMPEANPPTADTYVVRYNLIQQNRAKLVQANRLLQESVAMANVNPYAPADGYVYNTQKMQQLHQGIFELARSALILSRLSDDLNQQMTQMAYEARQARVQMPANSMAGMSGMAGMNTMTNMQQHGSMTGGDSSWIFNLAIIIIAFGMVLGVLILIKRLINDVKASQ
ncbi:hypothetical protein M7775_13485 [Sporomusa sphaeroides DSM 2875]|uniref:hypothetical protein n=1 Tax=Sporomusa sphaeroides TaxID=47679 RepID=UPI00202F2C0E|nr:hypothetical protein [Sporomusa sphaeroides]MCM0759565.1 hypothetical protein [Sporomusa sphaeroides DSM 2875]